MAGNERLICRAEDLLDAGRGVRFMVRWNGRDEPAFVIRHGGRVMAYLNRCAHVPVELDWQDGEFLDHSKLYLVCATHGALYSPEDGRCVGGRCNGQSLASLTVEERDGAIYFIPSEQTR